MHQCITFYLHITYWNHNNHYVGVRPVINAHWRKSTRILFCSFVREGWGAPFSPPPPPPYEKNILHIHASVWHG